MMVRPSGQIAGQEVANFLAEYTIGLPAQRANLDVFADELATNGNESFCNARPFHVVCVSAGQAATHFLENDLEQLACQARHASFMPTIAVDVNRVDNSRVGKQRIQEGATIVKRVQDRHPDLPLSYFTSSNHPNTSIGMVRDKVFGAMMLNQVRQSESRNMPVHDMLFTNWDTGTLSATPTYFDQLQKSFMASDKKLWFGYPMIMHEQLDSHRFPAASRLVRWYDLAQYAGRSAGPMHFSINLDAYAIGRGFQDSTFSEHIRLWWSAVERAGTDSIAFVDLPEAVTINSADSIVDRMARNVNFEYKPLRAEAHGQSRLSLIRDVSERYFDSSINDLTYSVLQATFKDRLFDLRHLEDQQAAKKMAFSFAKGILMAGALTIGSIHGTNGHIKNAIQRFAETKLSQ